MIACLAVLAGWQPASRVRQSCLTYVIFFGGTKRSDTNTCGGFRCRALPARCPPDRFWICCPFPHDDFICVAIESAFAIARALLTVSSYSECGLESATMPAPV